MPVLKAHVVFTATGMVDVESSMAAFGRRLAVYKAEYEIARIKDKDQAYCPRRGSRVGCTCRSEHGILFGCKDGHF